MEQVLKELDEIIALFEANDPRLSGVEITKETELLINKKCKEFVIKYNIVEKLRKNGLLKGDYLELLKWTK